MFEEFLAYLEEAGVRFVVVGGLAVIVQGYTRATADIDLVLDLDPANVHRAISALTARGFRPLAPVNPMDFADPEKRRHLIETKNLEVFSMRDERNPLMTVDLFARDPIPFEELWSAATSAVMHGRTIRFASVEHLIQMKRAVGRPQDLVDVAELEALSRNVMSTEPDSPPLPPEEDWDGSFEAAEEHRRNASLAATPSQRLAWLEEVLVFAARVGALPRKE